MVVEHTAGLNIHLPLLLRHNEVNAYTVVLVEQLVVVPTCNRIGLYPSLEVLLPSSPVVGTARTVVVAGFAVDGRRETVAVVDGAAKDLDAAAGLLFDAETVAAAAVVVSIPVKLMPTNNIAAAVVVLPCSPHPPNIP